MKPHDHCRTCVVDSWSFCYKFNPPSNLLSLITFALLHSFVFFLRSFFVIGACPRSARFYRCVGFVILVAVILVTPPVALSLQECLRLKIF